jgi:hypothetical protein
MRSRRQRRRLPRSNRRNHRQSNCRRPTKNRCCDSPKFWVRCIICGNFAVRKRARLGGRKWKSCCRQNSLPRQEARSSLPVSTGGIGVFAKSTANAPLLQRKQQTGISGKVSALPRKFPADTGIEARTFSSRTGRHSLFPWVPTGQQNCFALSCWAAC